MGKVMIRIDTLGHPVDYGDDHGQPRFLDTHHATQAEHNAHLVLVDHVDGEHRCDHQKEDDDYGDDDCQCHDVSFHCSGFVNPKGLARRFAPTRR